KSAGRGRQNTPRRTCGRAGFYKKAGPGWPSRSCVLSVWAGSSGTVGMSQLMTLFIYTIRYFSVFSPFIQRIFLESSKRPAAGVVGGENVGFRPQLQLGYEI